MQPLGFPASLNEVEDVFHLDANYSATTDDPGRTNYNLGVNEGIAYILCEFGNLQPLFGSPVRFLCPLRN